MRDSREMLRRIITYESRSIESMTLSLKEDELTILRLQNKANCLQREIEERKQLVKEYRNYLKRDSVDSSTKIRLIPSAGQPLDTKSTAS
jgi:hypothetical protein